jgi:hypothetical protein
VARCWRSWIDPSPPARCPDRNALVPCIVTLALRAAVAELVDLQADYAAWLDRLPESLRDTATAEALEAITAFDLSELEALEPPKGFGRD